MNRCRLELGVCQLGVCRWVCNPCHSPCSMLERLPVL